MTAVLFQTPGLIDIRSFTTFGVNAKPNSTNPIGHFGTGLKYAVAVCCRLGANPIVWIGRTKYTFYVKDTEFRDKSFALVRMKREKWSLTKPSHHDLPFTTELGKEWQAWQAFRELESNTRDEGGKTQLVLMEQMEFHVTDDSTAIVIENNAFTEAYQDRDKIFLPQGLSVREGDATVQVVDKQSKTLYYRGLRAADLRKPSLFTYNFLAQLDLTEDRTIKHDYMARATLARHVVRSDDEQFIEKVLVAPDTVWEHGLELDYQNDAPSDAFRRVIERRSRAVSKSALRYYGAWASPTSYARPPDTFELYPRPWSVENGYAFDANGKIVCSTELGVQVMRDIVDAVNQAGDPEQVETEDDHQLESPYIQESGIIPF